MKVVLINYANGKFKKAQNLNAWSAKYIGKVDKVICYSPKDIDSSFQEEHKNLLENQRGNGLWLWKPYFIYTTLKNVDIGDVVFYCDSGSYFCRSIKAIRDILETESIFVTELPLQEQQFTHPSLFDCMGCQEQVYKESNQISASFVVVKKDYSTMKIVREWLDLCSKPPLLNPCLPVQDNPFFISHREDQSILSLLLKKNGISPHKDISQFGRFPKLYDNLPGIVLQKCNSTDSYKTCLVHHRSNCSNKKILLKYWIYAMAPRKLVLNYINKR